MSLGRSLAEVGLGFGARGSGGMGLGARTVVYYDCDLAIVLVVLVEGCCGAGTGGVRGCIADCVELRGRLGGWETRGGGGGGHCAELVGLSHGLFFGGGGEERRWGL